MNRMYCLWALWPCKHRLSGASSLVGFVTGDDKKQAEVFRRKQGGRAEVSPGVLGGRGTAQHPRGQTGGRGGAGRSARPVSGLPPRTTPRAARASPEPADRLAAPASATAAVGMGEHADGQGEVGEGGRRCTGREA